MADLQPFIYQLVSVGACEWAHVGDLGGRQENVTNQLFRVCCQHSDSLGPTFTFVTQKLQEFARILQASLTLFFVVTEFLDVIHKLVIIGLHFGDTVLDNGQGFHLDGDLLFCHLQLLA